MKKAMQRSLSFAMLSVILGLFAPYLPVDGQEKMIMDSTVAWPLINQNDGPVSQELVELTESQVQEMQTLIRDLIDQSGIESFYLAVNNQVISSEEQHGTKLALGHLGKLLVIEAMANALMTSQLSPSAAIDIYPQDIKTKGVLSQLPIPGQYQISSLLHMFLLSDDRDAGNVLVETLGGQESLELLQSGLEQVNSADYSPGEPWTHYQASAMEIEQILGKLLEEIQMQPQKLELLQQALSQHGPQGLAAHIASDQVSYGISNLGLDQDVYGDILHIQMSNGNQFVIAILGKGSYEQAPDLSSIVPQLSKIMED